MKEMKEEKRTELSFYEQFAIEADSVTTQSKDSTYDLDVSGKATDYGTC